MVIVFKYDPASPQAGLYSPFPSTFAILIARRT